MAWGPMLEGLQKREETIKNSVEEAKHARAETERIAAEFKAKMDQAYAEIPKIMEQARREAEAFKEDMRAQTAKDIQTERQRLRREIETARDQALQELWNQAAQLATLISAKAIGRALTEDDHRRLLDEAIVELGQATNRR
jgi:F-type H+-transporting ATPase subunit b